MFSPVHGPPEIQAQARNSVRCLDPGLHSLRSVQSLSHVQLIATPWTAACQASLSITNSQSLLKLMSIELVMPSNRVIFCHPVLLLPSVSPSIRVFSEESALCIRWPKYWSFHFSISPFNENSGLISFRVDWFDLHAVLGTFNSLLLLCLLNNPFITEQLQVSPVLGGTRNPLY